MAEELKKGRRLAYEHRDYCGMGLAWKRGVYYHLTVTDGEFIFEEPLTPGEAQFSSDAEFVVWLAMQTDRSLSGRGLVEAGYEDNQRITRERLREFVGELPKKSRLP